MQNVKDASAHPRRMFIYVDISYKQEFEISSKHLQLNSRLFYWIILPFLN